MCFGAMGCEAEADGMNTKCKGKACMIPGRHDFGGPKVSHISLSLSYVTARLMKYGNANHELVIIFSLLNIFSSPLDLRTEVRCEIESCIRADGVYLSFFR